MHASTLWFSAHTFMPNGKWEGLKGLRVPLVTIVVVQRTQATTTLLLLLELLLALWLYICMIPLSNCLLM